MRFVGYGDEFGFGDELDNPDSNWGSEDPPIPTLEPGLDRAKWEKVADCARRRVSVPLISALFLDPQAYYRTGSYEIALLLSAVMIEGTLPGLVASSLDKIGKQSASPEDKGLQRKSGKIARWLSRQESVALLRAFGEITKDEADQIEAIAKKRNDLVHPEPDRPFVTQGDASNAIRLASDLKKRS